jgi:regulatory protein
MRSRRAGPQDAPPAATAFPTALAMLARRELSESQIRQRLARRGYEADAIDDALHRLKQDGAVNDARVAAAIARSETGLRRRGRRRVAQRIQQAGISGSTAREALDAVFADLDDEALLASALEKRLRGEATIPDDRTFQRLYRFLVSQGFEHDRVMKALRARRRRERDDEMS